MSGFSVGSGLARHPRWGRRGTPGRTSAASCWPARW